MPTNQADPIIPPTLLQTQVTDLLDEDLGTTLERPPSPRFAVSSDNKAASIIVSPEFAHLDVASDLMITCAGN